MPLIRTISISFSSPEAIAFNGYQFIAEEWTALAHKVLFKGSARMWTAYRNTIWVCILPGLISAFDVIILRAFISTTIPDSLSESAKLDGTNEFQIYWRIIMPLFKAGLATQEAQQLLRSMPGESTRTAMTIISILLLLVCYPSFQRHFISGLTVGCVKG